MATPYTASPSVNKPVRRRNPGGPGRWWLGLLGIVFILIGLALAFGGVWLITLGGTFYYTIAGIGLIVSGGLIVMRNILGVWVYAATWIYTLLWAFWEVGLDPWPLVPRLVAPTVLLIVLLLSLPAFRRRIGAHVPATAVALLASLAVLSPAAGFHDSASAQDATPAPDAGQPADPAANPAIAPQTMPDQPATDATGAAMATSNPAMKTIAATGANVSTKPLQELKAGQDWPAYGGGDSAQRYSPLDQITAGNVKDLTQVWLAHTGDMPTEKTKGEYSPENTPLEVGGHLFVCSPMNILISYDAKTGKEEWRYDPKVSPDAIPYGATCRGVAYYVDPNATDDAPCKTRLVEGTLDARLIAVDAKDGQTCPGFGEKGEVDLNNGIGQSTPGWYAITAPPVIVRGIAVVGAQVKDGQAEDAPSGVIRGYDVLTGKLAWAWDMGHPDRQGAPPEGETYTRGTPNMWTVATGDEELGYVYLPLGNSSVDYYGGNRKDFENEYSSSLVAIDVTIGKPVWHFQTAHYDLWDYDLGSQVSLVDFPKDGKTVPALVLPSKQGQIYVLNRKTGESLFPVENRKVPSDGVEAKALSKEQPFSGYANVTKPDLKATDAWGASPLDQLICRIQFRRAEYDGKYTAPTVDKPYIEYPGYNGGSDWGSVAIDPKNGILVANYNDVPNYNQLVPRKKADALGYRPINEGGNRSNVEGAGDPQAGSPYAINVNAGWRNPVTGMPCVAPPYGWIRAIDLKTGKTLWDKPFGAANNNGPFGIPSMLPITIGTPNNGGPLVTAGGLIFVAATTDDKFRAYDIKTGKVVWETDLPAGGQTTPMTYEVDGRQYVVLVPGGHHFMETKVGDQVIAYALPKQG
ncbi:membrane-bound PQQ-dependent dehydrogenase, glucose/quinate/shikimate family [Rhizobium halophytocola]|uniref:Quinoprotein glucose dehydrogenase n=1 Tax=Rhizobium halophytocola TaxID=735519 RepID=A0ABS4E327_9HYPH|nr:membrane-bound PQQ-dependent dehydrogenase, glucose/quinate/shikimate family [Rhizobium halophytocola]MBP1852346.1 quinoprotein glucose dehydrogenase [Rhizobium halophytocola]